MRQICTLSVLYLYFICTLSTYIGLYRRVHRALLRLRCGLRRGLYLTIFCVASVIRMATFRGASSPHTFHSTGVLYLTSSYFIIRVAYFILRSRVLYLTLTYYLNAYIGLYLAYIGLYPALDLRTSGAHQERRMYARTPVQTASS